ncbi:anaerobic ribonucleoside-triphosphate reductase activating protein [Methanoregula sp.]|uniref:anaerobic ribonucleoside-triphosphate reductase activating protein n=1 Tax=Methanoregula sp. TaxID=2052170 RepID=UPI0026332B5C|nr:anaerobic ribonucleoside-triphosphate reductase activating protein [Methanoregula sp.]MDD5143676.1 anaerobic ribonucleoside-triphosphate reductase activating protein [Methanoregula sp.]
MNFGGFVPISTIDWRGRAVCTVFLRGCPLRCSYCQNEAIQTGQDFRDIDEIREMIDGSAPFVSGIVISGGEPTLQKDAVVEIARHARSRDLKVGLQTNGLFPGTLESLIKEKLVDRVAIDYKTRWEGFSGWQGGYSTMPAESYEKCLKKSISHCKNAARENVHFEFEVVITTFYENADYIEKISKEIGTAPLVLQQGEHKIIRMRETAPDMTNGEYICKRRTLQENHPPLTLPELKAIADELGRTVRIRTREIGEISYESDWRRRNAGKRKR